MQCHRDGLLGTRRSARAPAAHARRCEHPQRLSTPPPDDSTPPPSPLIPVVGIPGAAGGNRAPSSQYASTLEVSSRAALARTRRQSGEGGGDARARHTRRREDPPGEGPRTLLGVPQHSSQSLEFISWMPEGPTWTNGSLGLSVVAPGRPTGTPGQCCVAARGSDAAAARVASRQCASRPAGPCLGSVWATSNTASRPIRRPETPWRMVSAEAVFFGVIWPRQAVLIPSQEEGPTGFLTHAGSGPAVSKARRILLFTNVIIVHRLKLNLHR